MVRQTKTFKKGNVTKKALSAILAASMVMTSSSFVMAAPTEIVVGEGSAAEVAPLVVEEEESASQTEERVGTEVTAGVLDTNDDHVELDNNIYKIYQRGSATETQEVLYNILNSNNTTVTIGSPTKLATALADSSNFEAEIVKRDGASLPADPFTPVSVTESSSNINTGIKTSLPDKPGAYDLVLKGKGSNSGQVKVAFDIVDTVKYTVSDIVFPVTENGKGCVYQGVDLDGTKETLKNFLDGITVTLTTEDYDKKSTETEKNVSLQTLLEGNNANDKDSPRWKVTVGAVQNKTSMSELKKGIGDLESLDVAEGTNNFVIEMNDSYTGHNNLASEAVQASYNIVATKIKKLSDLKLKDNKVEATLQAGSLETINRTATQAKVSDLILSSTVSEAVKDTDRPTEFTLTENVKISDLFNSSEGGDWKVEISGGDLIDPVVLDAGNYQSTTSLPSKPGTYTIKVVPTSPAPTGNHLTADLSANFSIQGPVVIVADREDLYAESNAMVKEYTFTGGPIKPEVQVKLDADGDGSGESKILEQGQDYDVEYSNNINVGTAEISIVFKNSYKKYKTRTVTYKINQAAAGSVTVEMNDRNQTVEYDAKSHAPQINSVKVNGSAVGVNDYEVKLVKRAYDDVIQAYPSSGEVPTAVKNAGVYDIYIVGKNNRDFGPLRVDDASFIVRQREWSAANIAVEVENVEYTGEITESKYFNDPQHPELSVVTVTDKGLNVGVDQKDYEIRFVDPKGVANTQLTPLSKDLGSYEIELVPVSGGNYKMTGSALRAVYEVVQNNLKFVAKKAVPAPLTYTGVGQLPDINFGTYGTAKPEGSDKKTEFADFTVEYPEKKDCVDAGFYTVKLVGKNKYANQEATVRFAISPRSIQKHNYDNNFVHPASFIAPKSNVGNTRKPFVDIAYMIDLPDETVDYPYQLVEGKDFTTTVNAAKKTVTVYGMGNFTTGKDGVTFTYEVSDMPVNLNDPSIKVTLKKSFPYEAKRITPQYDDFELSEVGPVGSWKLLPNVHYRFVTENGQPNGTPVYRNNINVGTGYILVEAITENQTGEKTLYTGQRWIPFEITANEVASVYKLDTMNVKSEIPYDGKLHMYDVVFGKYAANDIMVKTVKDNAYVSESENKSLKYFRGEKEITDSHDCIMKFFNDTDWAGTEREKKEAVLENLEGLTNQKLQELTGTSITMAQLGIDPSTNREDFAKLLSSRDDFTMPGTITAEVEMRNYTGKLTYAYSIKGKELADAISIDYNVPDQKYTGEEIKPAIKITEKGVPVGTVVEGRDYQITYVDNINIGRAYAVVEGIGNYSGKYYVPFNIVGQMDQKIDILDAQERDLGNGTRNLNMTGTKIKYKTAPKTDVTYTSSNTDVATVDAQGNIKYKGLGETTITIAAQENEFYKAETLTLKVVVTLKTPTVSVYSKNNAFTFTTSTVKGAEKFEVQYATKKDFSNAQKKTFTTTGKLRQVKISAKDKKTYVVRVRAINGTTKTPWSPVKTVATK